MAKFMMFGMYSPESISKISSARTKKVRDIIKKAGGQVEAMYVLMGENDLALIVDFPGIQQAMKGSIELTRQTGISFSTSPALTVEEFDKLFK